MIVIRTIVVLVALALCTIYLSDAIKGSQGTTTTSVQWLESHASRSKTELKDEIASLRSQVERLAKLTAQQASACGR